VHPEKFKQVMGLPCAERHGCAQACASGEWEHFQPRAIARRFFDQLAAPASRRQPIY
jgi:hypothetical protein